MLLFFLKKVLKKINAAFQNIVIPPFTNGVKVVCIQKSSISRKSIKLVVLAKNNFENFRKKSNMSESVFDIFFTTKFSLSRKSEISW